jgi:hypothetical protein
MHCTSCVETSTKLHKVNKRQYVLFFAFDYFNYHSRDAAMTRDRNYQYSFSSLAVLALILMLGSAAGAQNSDSSTDGSSPPTSNASGKKGWVHFSSKN